MLYIDRERARPSPKIIKEISRVKGEYKELLDRRDTHSAREAFDSLDKELIRKGLLKQQHGLCAYCMRRIENNYHMTIDHWDPIERNVDGALDYDNMLGTCDGGKGAEDHGERRVLCCDASKGDQKITLTPYDQEQMKKICYNDEGLIYTSPKDEVLEGDINDVLHLNGERDKNGARFDTATRLLRGRREAYRSYARLMETLAKQKKCTRAVIEKKIKELEAREIYDEYMGVILYFLKRKARRTGGNS